MKERVACLSANCSYCREACFVKENYWRDKFYTCSANCKKHKAISAEDCGKFRCRKRGEEGLLCRNCKGGN